MLTVVLVITFALIGFVALSVVTGNSPDLGNSSLDHPTPQFAGPAETQVVGTPDPSTSIPFKSAALGFSLEYPRDWQQNEQGLQVVFSPSVAGFDLSNLQAAALWFGIPADNIANPIDLSTRIQASLSANSQPVETSATIIGGITWHLTRLRFESEQLGGPAFAEIATTNKNEVTYFMVAVAPAAEWEAMQPVFQTILNSFQFTSEAVLRPTDATPPPTPTPTPTPIVHIVQSGETLSHIAVRYGVTIEALAARNNIDDPRTLQTGTKLIIPLKRR
jgi:LysM repeat protein